MNKSMIRYLLSKLLLIEAVLLLVPVAVALYYRESSQVFTALFTTIGILLLLGGSEFYKTQKSADLCQGGSLDCGPSVESFGLSLVVSPLSFLGKSLALLMPF